MGRIVDRLDRRILGLRWLEVRRADISVILS